VLLAARLLSIEESQAGPVVSPPTAPDEIDEALLLLRTHEAQEE
jgi:hypothetical protein